MSNQTKPKFLQIATLGRSVGLKGDMKLHLQTDFPTQFQKGATFYLNPTTQVTVASVDLSRGIIRLEGCNTPEEAKKLTNKKLFTTIEATREHCELDDGEFFWFDIEGCHVYEEDLYLGDVVEIERLVDNDYLKIDTSQELQNKKLPKTFLIPYHDHFIKSVDIEKKRIEVVGGYDILEAS